MGDDKKRISIRLRVHQHDACTALDRTRFGVLICHRRFGKTVLAVIRLIRNAVNTKRRAYRGAYIAPLYRQAKAVAWDYLKFFAGQIPGVTFRETDLTCNFPNGARITLHGADNPDSLRGLDLCDVVFDEVADMPKRVWTEIVFPMLIANDGAALFIGTPRGKNTLYDIWTEAAASPAVWSRLMFKATETNIIPPDRLEQARLTMDADEFDQEFNCSFAAGVKGAYYAHLLDKAEAEGRIVEVRIDLALPVRTCWDLGMDDMTSIWFFQQVSRRDVRWVDYYENSGEGLPHYVDILRSKGYRYDRHVAPHDIRVRELGTGQSRLETAAKLGLHFEVCPQISLQDGIQAVRNTIPVSRFDAVRCMVGLTGLRHYRREYDDQKNVFRNQPLHDYAEHPASAYRYGAIDIGTGVQQGTLAAEIAGGDGEDGRF